MQYAMVEGSRKAAFSGGRGNCSFCGSEMIAKCGPRVIHHWAHSRDRDCDPWWENETPWHRSWKELFPEDCREVTHKAADDELHRADIKTRTGIIIEVQHSNMSDKERISREAFYGNMAWILDGSEFEDNFFMYHFLPDPDSDLAKDLIWYEAKKGKLGLTQGTFYRRSECSPGDTMVRVYGIREVENEIMENWSGHRQFDWIRPRKMWLESGCPVFIDFGDEYLVKLEKYGDYGMSCVRIISKKKFVHDAMVETTAANIASRFYPVSTG